MEHIIGIIGIAITVLLAVYIHWRASKALLAIFRLVFSLPGGEAAMRIYEDIRKSNQVRGIPELTKDGKWQVFWRIPPYKEEPPKF